MNVIKYMNEKGYFQREEDYKKCLMWIEKGIIPDFMIEDYESYKSMMEHEKTKTGE